MNIRVGDIFQWIDDRVVCDSDAGDFVLIVAMHETPNHGMPLVIVQDQRGKTTDWTVSTFTRCANRVVEAPWE